ncbi:MAG: DUF3333 domain-containing protein, partial [Pseudomonadota bacterium]
MSDISIQAAVEKTLKRRYARERRFRAYGLAAVLVGLVFLVAFFANIVSNGVSAFRQTEIVLPVIVSAADVDPKGDRSLESLEGGDYDIVIRDSLARLFLDVKTRVDKRAVGELVSAESSFLLRERVLEDPDLIGEQIELRVPASANIDMLIKGNV